MVTAMTTAALLDGGTELQNLLSTPMGLSKGYTPFLRLVRLTLLIPGGKHRSLSFMALGTYHTIEEGKDFAFSSRQVLNRCCIFAILLAQTARHQRPLPSMGSWA